MIDWGFVDVRAMLVEVARLRELLDSKGIEWRLEKRLCDGCGDEFALGYKHRRRSSHYCSKRCGNRVRQRRHVKRQQRGPDARNPRL